MEREGIDGEGLERDGLEGEGMESCYNIAPFVYCQLMKAGVGGGRGGRCWVVLYIKCTR